MKLALNMTEDENRVGTSFHYETEVEALPSQNLNPTNEPKKEP